MARLRGKTLVTGGLGTATRTTGLLGGIFSFAVSEGVIDANPVIGVKKPAYNVRYRRLNKWEFRALGKVLRNKKLAGENPQTILIAALLALTGCRRGEIIGLRWKEVDFEGRCLRLGDSKEGYSVRPIGIPAVTILTKLNAGNREEFVFPAPRSKGAFGGFPNGWKRIAAAADFVDVTPHTLRHSFASVAADLGFSEPTIASLLGHSGHTVTRGYIHQMDEVLVAAADKVANAIAEMMGFDEGFVEQ